MPGASQNHPGMNRQISSGGNNHFQGIEPTNNPGGDYFNGRGGPPPLPHPDQSQNQSIDLGASYGQERKRW